MGFLSPPSIPTPPPPPPVPPAANPPTYANSQVQASGGGAQARMKAAAGAGFDNTIFTGAGGLEGASAAGPAAKQQLLGT